MDAIRLQRVARWFWLQHIRIIPGVITKWIHFRYNCDITAYDGNREGNYIRSWRNRCCYQFEGYNRAKLHISPERNISRKRWRRTGFE